MHVSKARTYRPQFLFFATRLLLLQTGRSTSAEWAPDREGIGLYAGLHPRPGDRRRVREPFAAAWRISSLNNRASWNVTFPVGRRMPVAVPRETISALRQNRIFLPRSL